MACSTEAVIITLTGEGVGNFWPNLYRLPPPTSSSLTSLMDDEDDIEMDGMECPDRSKGAPAGRRRAAQAEQAGGPAARGVGPWRPVAAAAGEPSLGERHSGSGHMLPILGRGRWTGSWATSCPGLLHCCSGCKSPRASDAALAQFTLPLTPPRPAHLR